MSDKLLSLEFRAKVHNFSDIYKKYIYIILQKCLFLLFLSLVPCISAPCKRPKKNQGEEVPRMALRVLRPNYPHSKEKAQYIE